jgi:sec-independent protein translocase protein TatB
MTRKPPEALGGSNIRARSQNAFPEPQQSPQCLEFVSAKGVQVSLLSMGPPPTIEVANLGMADSLILMVMALVVFGPRKLPQIGRQIGKLMYEFRKASNDFKFQMEEELRNAEDAERRKQDEERQRALALAAPPLIETQKTAEPSPPSAESAALQPSPTPGASQPEESLPRIMPPSTGEPVPAARPWSPPAQIADESNTEPEAAAEQETHHG